MSRPYRAALFIVLASSFLLLTGCGSSKSSKTQLRALQASPDESTSLNVLLDGTTLFSGITLGMPTSYTLVTSGARQLVVEPSNTTIAAINQSITLNGGSSYTLVTSNYAASLTPILLTDSTTAAASDKFNIRVVNAAVEASSVDVYILAPGSPNPSGGSVTPTVSGLGFTSSSAYQSLSAGSYQIAVSPAGFPGVEYINLASVSFGAGQNRTFVILPNGAGGISSLMLSDLN